MLKSERDLRRDIQGCPTIDLGASKRMIPSMKMERAAVATAAVDRANKVVRVSLPVAVGNESPTFRPSRRRTGFKSRRVRPRLLLEGGSERI